MSVAIADYIALHNRLASLRKRMISAASAWRAAVPEASVTHDINFASYDADFAQSDKRLVLELYVEISIPDGRYVSWWVDLEPKDGSLFYEAIFQQCDGNRKDHPVTTEWARCEPFHSVECAFDQIEALMGEVEQAALAQGVSIFE